MSDSFQLSLFAATDNRVLNFMERFKTLSFGRSPDSWCHCQNCEMIRLVGRVRNGMITPAEFKPWFDKFVREAYQPPGNKDVPDPYFQLAKLGMEFQEEQP